MRHIPRNRLTLRKAPQVARTQRDVSHDPVVLIFVTKRQRLFLGKRFGEFGN
jgi:hypothetical protein